MTEELKQWVSEAEKRAGWMDWDALDPEELGMSPWEEIAAAAAAIEDAIWEILPDREGEEAEIQAKVSQHADELANWIAREAHARDYRCLHGLLAASRLIVWWAHTMECRDGREEAAG